MSTVTGRITARLLAFAVAVALASTAAVSWSQPAGASLSGSEQRLLEHINNARAADGLVPLRSHSELAGVARGWAVRMAQDHDDGGDRRAALRHNPSMSSQLPADYRRAGENVGFTVLTGASDAALVDRLHTAYMDSSAHRANVLGDYGHVGVGLAKSDNDTMWSAVVFMLAAAESSAPETPIEAAAEAPRDPPDPDPAEAAPEPPPETAAGSNPNAPPEPASPDQPPPEPAPAELREPTSEELFGGDWPDGYLMGGTDPATLLPSSGWQTRRFVWPGGGFKHSSAHLAKASPSR